MNAARTPEALFRALADETRLRILGLIGDSEVCVCYFVEALRLPQPTISRHLAYLRRTGLVATRKDGLWVHYRLAPLADEHERKIVREALALLAQNPVAQQDRKRFAAACCTPQKFVALQGAPAPRKAASSH